MSADAGQPRSQLLAVRVQKGEPESLVQLNPGTSLTVGRSPTVELTFDDKLLSRCHCVFDLTGPEPRLTDLGSRNGSYVNGRRVQSSFLKAGDVVRVGSLRIELRQPTYELLSSGVTVPVAAGAESAGEGRTPVPSDSLAPGASGRDEETIKLRGSKCGRCGLAMDEALALGGGTRVIDGVFFCPSCVGPHLVGEGLGPDYELRECLGAGGMGAVYRVERLSDGALYAVKILVVPPGRSLEIRRRRFLREGRIGLELDHVNIVKVHRWSFHDEFFYLVMDYVAGRGLEVVFARRQATAEEAIDIAVQVLSALSYAHDRGVVHRDIKPANILMDDDGKARLVDFGLAKHHRRASMTFVTEAGRPLGTVHFMPPEQVTDAKRADARSDLYSLGATLYKILSGNYPILANTHSEFLMRILEHEPMPLVEQAPHVPAALGEVVHRAMSKDPEHRYADAIVMSEALLAAKDEWPSASSAGDVR